MNKQFEILSILGLNSFYVEFRDGYFNIRFSAHGKIRELLHPAIPDEQGLAAALTAIKSCLAFDRTKGGTLGCEICGAFNGEFHHVWCNAVSEPSEEKVVPDGN